MQYLIYYLHTAQHATGLSPGEMLFRHGYRGAFPNRRKADDAFKKAVTKMKTDKQDR